MTSNEVVVEIKKIFNLKRCGHTGTLDPNVSGVLIVGLENATKAMPVLMGLDKEYEGVMHLHKDFEKKKLEEVISENFIGEIVQTPPVKSHVARKPRKREVYYFNILEKDGKDVRFKTKVQAGTYIRKLIHDIGEKLSIVAQMKELRRAKVGHFLIENSHTLDEIKKACEEWKSGNETHIKNILIPIEQAIPHIKKVYVKDSSISSIRNGAPIMTSDITKLEQMGRNEMVGIFSSKNELIAIGLSKINIKGTISRMNKSIIRIDRVF
jgi:H/ACA ribonucleoprotein complex subunit 4